MRKEGAGFQMNKIVGGERKHKADAGGGLR